MATVYEINKGVNNSIELKGIKAQYLIYLAIGLVSLLLTFAILFIIGLNTYLCLAIIVPAGALLFVRVQQISRKYGAYGLMKKAARKKLPMAIRSQSRQPFKYHNK